MLVRNENDDDGFFDRFKNVTPAYVPRESKQGARHANCGHPSTTVPTSNAFNYSAQPQARPRNPFRLMSEATKQA